MLVAEDEHLLARGLANDLTELGFEVFGPASNGQKALDLARERRPDIALLDIRMPVMDGLTAAQTLYQEHNIPVVILSAYSDPPYLRAGKRVGVFGYLLKPATLDELRVTLAISWARYLDQERLAEEVTGLQTKLEERKIIEKAKGILMKQLGVSEDQAMRTLQKQARDSRRPMAELAQAVLDASSVMDQATRAKAE